MVEMKPDNNITNNYDYLIMDEGEDEGEKNGEWRHQRPISSAVEVVITYVTLLLNLSFTAAASY